VELHLAFPQLGLLAYQQKSFALWGESGKMINEIFHGFLL
jgi:hypothetical protein